MKNKILQFFIILFSLWSFGQTGKEIIEKNIEKSGGLTAWKLLSSIQLKGNITLSLTEEFPIEIQQSRPYYTKISIFINGQKRTIEGYDGKQGYEMNYTQNQLVESSKYKVESFDNDFIDFENKGFKINYLGKKNVNGKDTYKVELIKNVNTTFYYFDTETYMLLKEEKNGEISHYSDYRKVGKLLFPFKIEGSNPAQKSDYVMIFNEIKTNIAFPKNTFKF